MKLKLYYMEISHPSNAARLMLDHKGLPYERVDVPPGLQPIVTRLRRFERPTVPALLVDGRRLQGSVPIARELEQLRPDPPLYPRDPALRATVEEVEEWCERELQGVPRHVLRWAIATRPDLLERFIRDLQRVPFPRVAARLLGPPIRRFCRSGGGTEAQVRRDLDALPAMLDRVERLLADGVLGGERRTAADFQVGTTLRAIYLIDDLRPLIESRSLDGYARSIWPELETHVALGVPPEWIGASDRAAP